MAIRTQMPDVPGFALQCDPVAGRIRWQSQPRALSLILRLALRKASLCLTASGAMGRDFFCNRSALAGIGLDVGPFRELVLHR